MFGRWKGYLYIAEIYTFVWLSVQSPVSSFGHCRWQQWDAWCWGCKHSFILHLYTVSVSLTLSITDVEYSSAGMLFGAEGGQLQSLFVHCSEPAVCQRNWCEEAVHGHISAFAHVRLHESQNHSLRQWLTRWPGFIFPQIWKAFEQVLSFDIGG